MKKAITISIIGLSIGLFFQSFIMESSRSKDLEVHPILPTWRPLFNGKNLNEWKGYNQKGIPKGWAIENGILELNPQKDSLGNMEGADLVTKQEFKNFELVLDWKISENGNSGIMFNVVEDPKYGEPYLTGPEIQILDNEGHPDGKIPKHRAGDLYDLIACSKESVKKVGEWNHVLLISNQGHLQIYLNGNLSVETQMHDANWDSLVTGSKFKSMAPDFAKSDHGKICLQNHGNKVSFKNIRVKVLPS